MDPPIAYGIRQPISHTAATTAELLAERRFGTALICQESSAPTRTPSQDQFRSRLFATPRSLSR
jgi:hypothetical protein